MKKKFFAVVAAVVAFVMCFALIACGNPDAPDTPGNKTSEKEGMAKQAATAVTAVLDKEGVSGNLGIKLTATGEKAIELSGAFEKSGNRVKVVSGDEEMLLDLTTGYMYTLENGAVVYCEGVMPTGLYDYVVNMVEKYSDSAQMSPEVWAELDDLITYDTATKTVSYKLDLAEQINGLTEALYEGYKGNKSLTWLLDEYLLYFTGNIQFSPIATGQTGTSIVDMISGFALTFPDTTVGGILDTLKTQYGVDVEALLAEQGVDVVELLKSMGVETTAAALKARTLEQVIVGAYKAFTQAMQSAAEGDEGDGMMQILPVILNGAVNGVIEKGDPTAAQVIDGLLKTLVEMTDNLHIKALVDQLADSAPELVAVISAGVQLKELSVAVDVKLDENNDLDKFNIAFVFEHDYKGAVQDYYYVLSHNKYTVELALDITAYTDAPDEFTLTYGDMSDLYYVTLSDAIVVGDTVTEDVKVFAELGGRQKLQNATVTVGVCVYDENGYPTAAPNENITYDAATSVITVKAKYLADYFATTEPGEAFTLFVDLKIKDDNGYYSGYGSTLNIILLPDNIEDLQPILEKAFAGLIGNIGNGGNVPDVPPGPTVQA